MTATAKHTNLAASMNEQTNEHLSHCALEKLPAEVRRHVLSVSDLSSLKALVHASPTFHAQYLSDRGYILYNSLEATLGSVIVDLVGMHLCSADLEDVDSFLQTHEANMSRRGLGVPLADVLSLEEVITAVTIYFRFVKPTVEIYASWILDNLAKEIGGGHMEQLPLTSSETMRLTRAAYRYQLLCQLFNPEYDSPEDNEYIGMNTEEFLAILEPWEVEELYSFYQYADGECDKGFRIVASDMQLEGVKDSDDILALDGLRLLRVLRTRVIDHNRLVDALNDHMERTVVGINIDDGLLSKLTQDERYWGDISSERDEKQNSRDSLPFQGDGKPTAPPLAWTSIWGGAYSSLYGWYIPDEIRRWGYVFWDASRLQSTGAMEVLHKQWHARWGDEGDDPREYYDR